jgi:hypothetical protein
VVCHSGKPVTTAAVALIPAGHTFFTEETPGETPAMMRDDKPLRILLRIVGVLTLLTLVAVFMPKSWMASTHE